LRESRGSDVGFVVEEEAHAATEAEAQEDARAVRSCGDGCSKLCADSGFGLQLQVNG
jgi:hypothetical protein